MNRKKLVIVTNTIAIFSVIVLFYWVFITIILGDYLSAVKREKMLFASADLIVEESSNMMAEITNYSFNSKWIDTTADSLNLLSKLDKNYKRIYVIVQDKIDEKTVYLIFPSSSSKSDKEEPKKLNYIFQTDMDEKLYLGKVFAVSDGDSKKKFKSSDGNYELFYPIKVEGKTVVLWLKDR